MASPFAWIETERLRMRPFAPGDVDDLHAFFVLPDVRRYLWDDVAIERDTVVEVVEKSAADFEQRGHGLCVLNRREGDELAGFCGLRPFEDLDEAEMQTELMYGLHPTAWGRGHAYEASVAMLRFGFEHCGLAVIHGGIDAPNTRSRRVLERLGMTGWRTIDVHEQSADYARLARADFEAKGAAYRLLRSG